ncbi:pirin family protein [Pleionea sediminis]|uniref:pirin family protein n=1 Tax=Pleionea sediminis TaxID=2569479 RepID=UPI0011862343|nr:pirin family protein [Pleionea sediminis]
MKTRDITQIIQAKPASDGAGVRLNRTIGGGGLQGFDPFLMLDEFNSDNADDYIAGFPSHPHRGFETVTYMLEGNMLHEDHMGNKGLLQSGDVQWMTAARGIIHSEMPQQVEGRMRGFQLWINLPAKEKMNDPHYEDIKAANIPVIETEDYWVKVVAGNLVLNGQTVVGAVNGISTAPVYLDVRLKPNTSLTLPIADTHKLLLYVYEGEARVNEKIVKQQQMGVSDSGEELTLNAGDHGLKALVLAGKPLQEPIANWGPFVMNTREEIEQAISDYRNGVLTQ